MATPSAFSINDLVLPSGVDAGLIGQYSLQDGTNMLRFMENAQMWINTENRRLMDMWGGFYNIVGTTEVIYPNGHSPDEFQVVTDLTFPDQLAAGIAGHMTPLEFFHRAMGGSVQFFMSANVTGTRLESTVKANMYDGCQTFEKKLLQRLFNNTYTSVGTGQDAPFVDGNTTAGSYAPPPYAGRNFGTSHSHFNANSGAISSSDALATLINVCVKDVQEHGYMPPYTLLVADDDAQYYIDLTEAARMVQIPTINFIDRGGETSGSTYFANGEYGYGPNQTLTYFNSDRGRVNVVCYPRIPTGYMVLVSTEGQMKPLSLYQSPMATGFGIRLLPEFSGMYEYPIRQLVMMMEFGFTVGSGRTNGSPARMGNANYANPTIA